MNLVITVCATKKYMYAMEAQARKVQSACMKYKTGHIVLVGSDPSMSSIKEIYLKLMPGWKVTTIIDPVWEDAEKNYDENAQLLIAQMRTAAFCEARILDADFCLSLDSDVLPPENSVRCMLNSLDFDDGYYSISMCTYPSQGGGGFLGGRGTYRTAINPDHFEDEKEVPEELIENLKINREKMKVAQEKKDMKECQKIADTLGLLEKQMRECPPKNMNIWQMNAANGWRPRGWVDWCYPAMGSGVMVPTDWVGFGCTMMNRKALSMIDFSGYDGRGTEDLYICWHRWHPAGMKMALLLHCPCDHVIRNPGKEGYFVHVRGYHEPEGDHIGHLRIQRRPFYPMNPGEKHNKENDGNLLPKPKIEEKPKPVDSKK